MELTKRKPTRLRGYDYSQSGYYFVTICTHERRNLFWENVGASIARPQAVILSECGKIAESAINSIPLHYPAISVDKYVVMPNHIHMILTINCDENGRPMVAPTISTVVQQMKGTVTKQVGFSLWQRSFHDHIIRGENDYREIWNYIDSNPVKWTEDRFYNSE